MDSNYELASTSETSPEVEYVFSNKRERYYSPSKRCWALVITIVVLIFILQLVFTGTVSYGSYYALKEWKLDGRPLVLEIKNEVDKFSSIIDDIKPFADNASYYLADVEEFITKLDQLYGVIVPYIPFLRKFSGQFENITSIFIPRVIEFIENVEKCESKYRICNNVLVDTPLTYNTTFFISS